MNMKAARDLTEIVPPNIAMQISKAFLYPIAAATIVNPIITLFSIRITAINQSVKFDAFSFFGWR